jgi:hypothetical protein
MAARPLESHVETFACWKSLHWEGYRAQNIDALNRCATFASCRGAASTIGLLFKISETKVINPAENQTTGGTRVFTGRPEAILFIAFLPQNSVWRKQRSEA